MIFVIDPEFHSTYPAQIRSWSFQFIAASIHPQFNCWTVLLAGKDGKLYSMKREHVKLVTPLEILL